MAASSRGEKRGGGGGSESQAKELCLRLLSIRGYTSAELGAKLAARGFESDVAHRAIVRLTEVGLIDDHAYAQMFARTRHRDRRGKRVIAMELKRKGIPEEEVVEAVSQVSDDDERAVAVELVRKAMQRADEPTDAVERSRQMRRALGMLARRGFDAGLATEVVRSAYR